MWSEAVGRAGVALPFQGDWCSTAWRQACALDGGAGGTKGGRLSRRGEEAQLWCHIGSPVSQWSRRDSWCCPRRSLRRGAVPRVINYQARLTDSGGAPVKTAVTLTFTFWDAESGGAQLGGGYSDAKLVQPDGNGVVSTQVGADPGNPVPAVGVRGQRGVAEGDARRAGDCAAGARQFVGYAFRAADADAVGGVAAAAIALMADAFRRRGAHVVVETTASATANGANLLAAYAVAKALSPNGQGAKRRQPRDGAGAAGRVRPRRGPAGARRGVRGLGGHVHGSRRPACLQHQQRARTPGFCGRPPTMCASRTLWWSARAPA